MAKQQQPVNDACDVDEIEDAGEAAASREPIEGSKAVQAAARNQVAAAAPAPNVPELLDTIQNSQRLLMAHAAAYSTLMRTVDATRSACAGASLQDCGAQLPLFQWVTRFNGQAVEVATDLAALSVVDVSAVLTPLINLHAQQMQLATAQLHQAAGQLLAVITDSQQVDE